MKKTLTKICATLLACSTVLVLSSCGKKTVATPQISEEIHYAINGAPPSMDIQMITNVLGKMIAEEYVYQKLIAYDGNKDIFPMLAEKFEVVDNTEYTYFLRKGIMFHNGQEMTADDVVASMNRWIEKISSAGKIFGASRFVKVDDYTVKVTLDSPSIWVNETIAGANNYPAIYPKSVIDNADEKTGYIKEFIGTGPYKFVEWAADQYILLERNDAYKQIENGAISGFAGPKTAPTKRIYFEFVSDDSTRVAGIQTNEYDLIYKAPYDNFGIFEGNNKLNIFNAVYGDIWMVFNKKEGISTNPKFRQAVQAALNNDEILMGGYASKDFYRLNGDYMLEEQKTWHTSESESTYNKAYIQKAKDLLAEIGYNNEEFTLLVSPDYSDMYNSALVIQSQLTNAGINCQLLTTDWATMSSYRNDPSKMSAFITTGPAPISPNTILYLSTGWAGWAADEKLQDMMTQLNLATKIEDGVSIWKGIQKYCSEEYVPICHLGDIYRYSVGSTNLKDVGLTNYGPALWNAYLEK